MMIVRGFMVGLCLFVAGLLALPSRAQFNGCTAGFCSGIASVWTPASLPGLIGWWEADMGVTGSPVTAVVNQATPGVSDLVNINTVPFNATGFNGHPAFDFVAANNAGLLTVGGFAIGSGNKGSVFVIGQMKTDTNNGRAASYAKDASSNDYDNDGSADWLARSNTSNNIQTYRSGTDINTAVSLSTNYVFASIFDGTNVTHWINVVMGSTTSVNKNWVSGGFFAIGNGINPGPNLTGGAWDGPIAEVIVTNADSTPYVANVYSYAQRKYGI